MLYSHLKIRTAQLLDLEPPVQITPPQKWSLGSLVNTLTENRQIMDNLEAQCVASCTNDILTFLEYGVNQVEERPISKSGEIWRGLNQIIRAVHVMSLRLEQWIDDEEGRVRKNGKARLEWAGMGEAELDKE